MKLFARSLALFSVTALSSASLASAAFAQATPGGAPDFAGKIGQTRAESTPAYPPRAEAPKGAPNVLVILLDDAGFAATSTFGGAARTPNLDKLAADGLRYNRFHTTAICSPTRAALLTGRNHHQVGFGNVTEISAGFPGYSSVWNPQTASIAKILQGNGYSTAAFGKWHNTPRWEVTPAGPFERWPTRLGFDHFYGFMGGEDKQWEPNLYKDTQPVDAGNRPEDYHLTNDLVNKAIGWVDDHDANAPAKPYFLYVAPGAVHAPHDAPREWIAKTKGRFDQGWDKFREEAFARQKRLGVIPANAQLTPRPDGIPAWSSLTPEQRKLYAREMEVYVAMLEQTDAELGRLIDTLRKRPGGENLLIFFIAGDNGGSAEGGLDGLISNELAVAAGADNSLPTIQANFDKLGSKEVDSHYSVGWAWATNTPFQWTKQVASHFGGTRNPLVVSWTGHTAQPGKIRSQFGHVNDIAPTILDAAGIAFPEAVDGVKQLPFEGKSLVASFKDPAAPEQHRQQYFEIMGNRAIYKDGWVAGAKRSYKPWNLMREIAKVYVDDTANDRWELYNVDKDFSEAKDLAASDPAKLEELKAEFVKEGFRNNVFPLLPLPLGAPSSVDPARRNFTFGPSVNSVPQVALPNLTLAHRFEAKIDGDGASSSGVVLANGGRLGGWALFVKDGKLTFEDNEFGQKRITLGANEALPKGPVTVGFEFTPDPSAGKGPAVLSRDVPSGRITLLVNGKPVGETAVAQFPTTAGSFSEGFDIGQDRGSPASNDPAARQRFNQPLSNVNLQLK